jgi:hypothetical protein
VAKFSIFLYKIVCKSIIKREKEKVEEEMRFRRNTPVNVVPLVDQTMTIQSTQIGPM